MTWDKDRIIVANPDILSERHIPLEIYAREPQIMEIGTCFRPIAEGKPPRHSWLHGKSGVGKSATAKWILRKLEKESGFKGLYINCWKYPTFFSILESISRQMKILGADKISTSFKLDRIKSHLSGYRIALVLDEIDQPLPRERNSILYNLSDIPTLGLICICNSRYGYYSLEDRVKSRLNPSLIHFEEYTQDKLSQILEQRAQSALTQGAFDEDILRRVSALAGGDARIAIQTLKNAAYLAERENQKKIRIHHIKRSVSSAKEIEKTYLLRKLTDHHRLLYELIARNPGILSGDLWRMYLKTCNRRDIRPIALRTYSEYCNKLLELSLIQGKRAAILGKVREFSIVQ